MATRSLRARIAAVAALVLVAGGVTAAPALADEPAVVVRIIPATEAFMTDGYSLNGVVEAFDAASDLTVPAAPVPFELETTVFSEGSIGLELPPGAYKIKVTAEDHLPAWYQSPADPVDYDSPLEELPWLFGARSDGSADTASILTVAADGTADRPSAGVILHGAETSVAGILGNWSTGGWSMSDQLAEDQVGFAELFAVGEEEPLTAVEVTQGGAFVFRDIPLGTYEVRGVIGTFAGADAAWPHPELGPDDLTGPVSRWYPGVADRSAAMTVTIDAERPHWDGASVAMDEPDAAVDGFFAESTVTGDLYEGGTVFAGPATGSGDLGVALPQHLFLPLEYEWRIDDVVVPGQRGPSLVVPGGTAGSTLTATTIGTIWPAAILATSESRAAAPVAPSPLPVLTPAPVPSVAGTAIVGARLTAEAGTWGPGSVAKAYQWLRDGVAIPGATARAYTLTPADLGTRVSVAVTGSKPGYQPATRMSAETQAVLGASFTSTPVPTVRGTLRVGETLTTGSTAWRPTPVTLSYQWFRNAVAIPGATAAAYALTADDLGAAMTVGVVATKDGYTTQSRTSAPTAAVALGRIVAPRPALVGTPVSGSTLSIDTSGWMPTGAAIAYEWQRSAGGGTFVTVAATPTYTLGAADVGRKVRLVVTVSAPGYETVQRTTAATPAITTG